MRIHLILSLLLFCSFSLKAHEGENQTDSATTQPAAEESYDQSNSEQHVSETSEEVTASFDEFPNLHPLIVHFPIVLLLVAVILSLANSIFLKKEIDWILSGTLLVATAGAYAAGWWFHPHTHDLSAKAQLVLEQHDLYAEWTLYLSIAALVAQGLYQFVFQGKRWAVLVVTVILVGAAYTVSRAGHYGSQLVYIEGVGPQGDYLESGNH
ncbi:MAG: hypothetical protein RIG62_27200 [Cyclobacteriaceae bacterium]